MAATVRAEAKAGVAELPFIDRAQDLADCLLEIALNLQVCTVKVLWREDELQ